MNKKKGEMELICVQPQAYRYSAELQLAQRMLFSGMQANSKITLIDDDAQQNQHLYEAIQRSQAEFIMLAKEPGIMVSDQGFEKLQQILQQHSAVTAVLAADLRDHAQLVMPPYLSLYGFEQFTHTLPEQLKDYDQRTIWLLVGKTSKLQAILSGVSGQDHVPPLAYLEKNSKGLIIAEHVFAHYFHDYYQQQRAELLPLLPCRIQNLLDIGCARGEFGAMIKQQFGCRVMGMEFNRVEAEYARQRLDQVLVGDALSHSLDERFDCVTCLDTLEHFDNAEALLTKITQHYLKENGYLLLSLPNIGHWSIVQDLLAGRWDYIPAGILCNTHLRFFTRHTIEIMLKEQGMNIARVNSVRVPMPDSFKTLMNQAEQKGFQVDLENLDILAFHILAQRQA